MKRISIIILLLCCLNGSVDLSAQTIDQCFIQMPLELLPALPVNSRMDLVDFYKNSRTAAMPAAFKGQMLLKSLSDDYLLLQTSSETTMQLKLLPLNDSSNVLAVVYTASAPLSDSRIRFYTTNWKPIETIKATQLTVLDFLDAANVGTEQTERFKQVCPRLFVKWQLAAETLEVQAITSIKEDVPPELLEPFKPWIKDTVTLKWQYGAFIKK